MLNVAQFRTEVVRPTLAVLGTWNATMNTPAAENLLIGTSLQESSLTYLRQLSGGPGLGVMQVETATHDDVWTNYLNYRDDLSLIVKGLAAGGKGTAAQLPWNLGYSVAIARLIFWRAPATMPAADDVEALGQFWKTYYNTEGGAGTAAQWVENYQKYAAT